MNAARLFEDMGGGFGRADKGALPLIVDSFAGGGGASTGIETALGRSPDIAINHDSDALAMHMVNHPGTLHLSKNIWHVDPIEAVGNRRVGLAWFSPDCKHFSKAKGGRPVKRNIRDLAWVVVLWAKRVRPEVIILENVEEFRDWGPLVEREPGKWVPCPDRRGQTFKLWMGQLKRCGYKIEWRELRACDYGAPTIRKRFFMIARRDGRPIVWPEPTHGPPDDPDVIAGRKLPWRTAAEIIDWSIPCPSIFDTSEQIKARFGVRAIRPLADATMKRIARGVMRYVLEAKRPFVVCVARAEDGFSHIDDGEVDEGRHQYRSRAMQSPSKIQAASTGLKQEKGEHSQQSRYPNGPTALEADLAEFEPVHESLLVPDETARITPGWERQLLPSRIPVFPADSPLRGQLSTRQLPKIAAVAAFLAQHNNDKRRAGGVNPGRPADEPLATLTASGAQQQVVAAYMSRQFGTSIGHALDEPTRTDTATANKSMLIAPFLQSYYGNGDGQVVDGPLRTDTTKDRFGLVTVEIDGATYAIADIGMRMLTPRERFRAQGFPDSYIIDRRLDGRSITQTIQGRCCGNSVCPPVAEALVRANCAHLAVAREAAE